MATFSFRNNSRLTEEENALGKESLDEFNEVFTVTCQIIQTFKGRSGKRLIAEVLPMIEKSPSLQQFLFELYYNTKMTSRLQDIYDEDG